MRRHRVGLIGCGRIGSEFEDLMPSPEGPVSISGAFASLPECELVAGCNRGAERLAKFGRRWKVEALYHDYRAMLEEQRPDIVAVATPPGVHREQVIAAAEAGARGVFCEKPMGLSLGECEDMIAACEASGTKLLVNCTRRWIGQYEAIRREAQAGRWGDLLHLVAYCQGCKPLPEWEADFEGPMLHDAVHVYDLMRFFAGDVEWVMGTASRRRRHDLRVEDSSLCILQFNSGLQAVAVVDELTEYQHFALELHFERGLVRMGKDFTAQRSVSAGTQEGWWHVLTPDELPAPAWGGTGVQNAARDLIRAMETDSEPRCNGRDGRAAIEIIMALYQAERSGHQKVHLPLSERRRMVEVLREEGVY